MAWTFLSEITPRPVFIQTFEDVTLRVEQAARHAEDTHGLPTFIELSLVGESVMGIVVGGDWSYAAFMYIPYGPGYYSHGGPAYDPATELPGNSLPRIYMQFGSQSELDQECTISPQQAWEALEEYYLTQKQPGIINWG